MTKIEEYAKEIPEEIRRAIRGLDSDYRTAIFVALHKHGELSFSDLQKALEIDKAMLSYHLGKLIQSALVHHYYKHELGTERYSFYNVTPFGQNFVETLSQFLRPQPCHIPLQESSTTSDVFVAVEDIVQRQMIFVTEEFLKEVLGYLTEKYTGGRTIGICSMANDTSIGSPVLGISIQAEKETIMGKRAIPPSTI